MIGGYLYVYASADQEVGAGGGGSEYLNRHIFPLNIFHDSGTYSLFVWQRGEEEVRMGGLLHRGTQFKKNQH